MNRGSGLATASLLLTYLLRTSAVSAVLSLSFCWVRNCRVRSRLNGLFLSAAAAGWLCILFFSAMPGARPARRIVSGVVSSRQFSWLIDSAILPQVRKALTFGVWLYAVILALLLARFCGQAWKRRTLLRRAEPPPGGLALLFELVRSATGSPGCELRLLDDLRSPATTGWRSPFVLIPRDLLPRLDRQQLMHVFQHELTHVRRRDYLWDRLSTLACYLIFFHPAAWWARRGWRWERELVCDDSVALSGEGRVEYASCLTTLAAWRSFDDAAEGGVHFLSSRSSLLAARVRALLADPRKYGPGKEIALTVLAMCALSAAALLVPTVVVRSYSIPDLAMIPHLATTVRHPVSPPARNSAGQARTYQVGRETPPAIAALGPVSSALDLDVRPVVPALSPDARSPARPPDTSEGDSQIAVASYLPSGGEYAPRSSALWNESPPFPPRRRITRAGRLALRAIQVGIGIAAAEIVLHNHDKAH